jgi:superfamily II DNA/RNA helicase
MTAIPLFGGMDVHQVWRDLKASRNELVIATPGRLIDMLRKKAFDLTSRCSFLVIDEAD